MRKILLLLFLVPVSVLAQNRFEVGAKSTIAKMVEVLALSSTEATEVYKVEYNKNEDVGNIRQAGGDDVRPKVGARMTIYNTDLEKLLGKEKFDKWKAYLKDEASKK